MARLAGRHRIAQTLLLAVLLPGAAPAAAPDPVRGPAGRLLSDGFEQGGFAPGGGLFYKNNPEQRAGKVAFGARAPLRGRGGLTLTVMPACAPDARGCSERAEVWERPRVLVPYAEAVWYGFAMRLEEPLPQDDRRHVMAQWKREIRRDAPGDFSPFLALRLYRGRLGFTVETDFVESFRIGGPQRPQGCLPGEARVFSRPKVRQTRALVAVEAGSAPEDYPGYFDACAPAIRVTRHADLPAARSGWIDFVVRSQPGPSGGGHIEILADGVPTVTVTGHVGHAGPGLGRNQYFKFGPYRAAGRLPWSVSYDDFRRGPRCSDVIRVGHCPAAP
ncbi:heparin lyase I family protein [Bosea minatitlanensis]|uniref:Heparin lyase I family protein n=1 Tax=Bosea minatitlanensis TaxID=128782 RepID=A0ABW0F0Z6_9HYPH|nr:heparin lyase I family protein [Bosea minatitlanensis]MCT4494107.1 polysaccharide lyase [Bosea minatitlanensis]